MKSLTRWLFETDRLRSDPLKSLRRDMAGERADRRHRRRALGDEEIGKLIKTTEAGPERFGMTGPERSVLYQIAISTGLRANEIRSLTSVDFDLADLDNATVSVRAAYAKNRREDTLPLRRDLAELLRDFIAGTMKMPSKRLFDLPKRTGELIKADLQEAGVPYEDDAGQIVDFHALRHTFITRLVRSGVSPAVVKRLARHSTITLTIDCYTHAHISDERAAINQLSPIGPTTGPKTLKATGTDDSRFRFGSNLAARRSLSMSKHGVECHDGVSQSGIAMPKGKSCKSLKNKTFVAECHQESSDGIDGNELAGMGLEPIRDFSQGILSPQRLPIPPPGRSKRWLTFVPQTDYR